MRYAMLVLVLLAMLRLAGCVHSVKASTLAAVLDCSHVVCQETAR